MSSEADSSPEDDPQFIFTAKHGTVFSSNDGCQSIQVLMKQARKSLDPVKAHELYSQEMAQLFDRLKEAKVTREKRLEAVFKVTFQG